MNKICPDSGLFQNYDYLLALRRMRYTHGSLIHAQCVGRHTGQVATIVVPPVEHIRLDWLHRIYEGDPTISLRLYLQRAFLKTRTVYYQVPSTRNLVIVAYIIHINILTHGKCMHTIHKISQETVSKIYTGINVSVLKKNIKKM